MTNTKIKTPSMYNFCIKLEENIVFDCLKKALVLMMPVILIGCLASVFLNFPTPAYQEFLKTAFSGHIFAALNWTYTATFSCLSLYLLVTIPIAFSQRVDSEKTPMYVMVSFISFLLIAYDGVNVVTLKNFESVYMFPTIVIAFISCGILYGFFKFFGKITSKHPAVGLEMEFQTILVSIPPLLATVLLFVVFRLTLGEIFHYEAIIETITKGFVELFDVVGYGALGSFIYVIANGLLYMFGIHGGNVLTPVLIGFYKNTFANVAAVENGVTAGAIPFLFNSTMLDAFVFMGGAGCLLCLMLALLLNFKNAYNKRIFALGILPSVFNISEIGYLGFPVIFNPIMFIPFVFTPVVMLGITSLAMYSGLVPICAVRSTWSLPVLFSGYYTTGSWRGVALQVVLLAIGTLIYLPFVKISQRLRTNMAKQNIKELSELIRLKEQTGVSSNLKSTDKRIADISRVLAVDLRNAMNANELELHYQPQMKSDNTLYGVEALLRWNHPVAGFIYPPLIIEIAREEKILDELGLRIIEMSCKTLERLTKNTATPIHLAVNISPTQLERADFCDNVKAIIHKYDFGKSELCFEITEQIALIGTGVIVERINELRREGIPFHMDDFGMGHSSMLYLQNNEFEAVKLDGSLTRDMLNNKRSKNIISGIQDMSKSLNYDLIAEYVETEEQRKALSDMGCQIYQGYLYSPALPLPLLEDYLEKNNIYEKPKNIPKNESLYL